ncbi:MULTISPECIES: hypothetical protein [unclassified Colwellia]|jgi:hypothetical protein|uniref:hypothetical protein n=1 Tax=unclassified Colwellia TaxID=196834 RepID=UPI0015F389F2|nr:MULTISPECIES: hypothetical protein [unclassified Colwellia]MBA6339160.1 hypothetical protein [Colwellia sp. BRX8-7]MBA6354085.1 hypothetical protein [Colwellia sp. BRX9-1]MBA6358111.1 hypothetical protein [Colwellia sp. BRX8-3]MBA6361864.1 hypothetical protein [Colwellia sp. BRX8-6]MBA6369509.1 hypothetical protein [Colwellia sp. BRX8-5]
MKLLIKFCVVLILLLNTTSCVTTSTYGATFEAIAKTNDIYTLKIYYGGPPPQWATDVNFQEGTDSALYEKAMAFIAENPEYNSYKVVDIEHSHIPSYYRYSVHFLRN